MFGGCTVLWSNMSAEAEIFAVRMTYGAEAVYKRAGREPTDYVNSKLIVMWGWSPGDGTFGTGTYQYLKQAKREGVRIVCVDPRKTRSSAVLADEHVFIQPSTDAAARMRPPRPGACGKGRARPRPQEQPGPAERPQRPDPPPGPCLRAPMGGRAPGPRHARPK